MTEHSLKLPDGRQLAYAEYGDPQGRPVLYFHGSPSSRKEPLLIGDETLVRLGLRLIAPDRPGMGGSDFLPNRGFLDWPKDVVALADALGLAKFAVLGYSGGGPYVTVCAARIPERLTAAVIVSGGWRMDAPETKVLPLPNRLMLTLARRAPWLLRLMIMAMGSMGQGEPAKELAEMKKRVPPADYDALAVPGRIEALGQTIRESIRPGTSGGAWDLRLYVREFGFRFEEIRRPIVLFHGERDANVPLALVQRMIRGQSHARLVTYPDDAHISTLTARFEATADALRGG